MICPVCQKKKQEEWTRRRIYLADPSTPKVVPQKCIMIQVLKPRSSSTGRMQWICPVTTKLGKSERYTEPHFRKNLA